MPLLHLALIAFSGLHADSLHLTQAPAAKHAAGEERIQWWRDARFGLFIHWGLYAIPAGEWEGNTSHAEWIRTTAQIPLEEYDQFVPRFNPVNFDAAEWARLAREAGMRYIVITTKHHDGFCLFNSAQTDFDIMATPFQRDIMKELSDATRAAGLRMGWYHSIMDWHHPDYLPRRDWEQNRSSAGAEFARFVEYLHAQVEELLTRYGPIDVMWFDGEWEETWTHEHGVALYDHVRGLSPATIINNRVDKGRAGMAGLTIDESFRGDFGTPEQEVPSTGFPGVDWESCMTMNDHWGYNAHDRNWKSTTTLIRTLVDIASKGGNFLLNVGPKADGTFPDEAVVRLREIGEWMKVHGEAIYGTSASPFGALPWGRCTMKEIEGGATRLYFHVFDWPADGALRIPGLANDIGEVTLLSSGDSLSGWRDNTDVVIELPDAPPNAHCSVIAVEISERPETYLAPSITTSSPEFIDHAEISIDANDSRIDEIRFTIDGHDPAGPNGVIYEGPFQIGAASAVIRARGFSDGVARTPVASLAIRKVAPRPAEVIALADLTPGLLAYTWRGEWAQVPEPSRGNSEINVVREIAPARAERVAMRFTGYLSVPADDIYQFSLTSDDGAQLFIGDAMVIDNDGLHVAIEKRGAIALAKGLHPITVEWFNRTGEVALELKVAALGSEPKPVEAGSLFHVFLE